MSLECPACGKENPETSAHCVCGQSLSKTPLRSKSQGGGKQGSKNSLPDRCPLCQGTNIRTDGWTGVDARVQFGKKWMGTGDTGFGLNCFACMDCGFVGHYLCTEDLISLQSRPVMSDWPPKSSRAGCFGLILLITGMAAACVGVTRLIAG